MMMGLWCVQVRRDRESGKIMNLVMAWAEKGMNLKVNVPVVFKGEDVCPGLKKGEPVLNFLHSQTPFLLVIMHKSRF